MRPSYAPQQVERMVRKEICSRCPRFIELGQRQCDTALPLPCQRDCELFHELPHLARTVRARDSMLRTAEQILNDAIDNARSRGPGSPLRKFRKPLVQLLASTAP
ncbi:hypothetical protein BH09PLA1_BH09PLA1_15020 [soil metagenome]